MTVSLVASGRLCVTGTCLRSKYREVARVVMHMMDEPGMTPSDTAFRDILHRCAAVRPAMLSAAARQRTSLAREVAARTGATLEETLEAMEQQDQDQNAAWLALRYDPCGVCIVAACVDLLASLLQNY